MKPQRSDGFTLIELVVATMLMSIVTVTLAGALSTVFVNSASTTVRFTQTHDAQNVTSYFTQDVTSVGVRNWNDNARPILQSVEQNVAYNAGLYPCGAAGTPSALVRMAWDDFDPADTTSVKLDVAAYVVKSTGGSGLSLHRISCQKVLRISDGAVLGSSTRDTVVVHALGSGAAVSCLPSQCTTTAVPNTITLNLVVHDARQGQPDYALSLSGHPRQS